MLIRLIGAAVKKIYYLAEPLLLVLFRGLPDRVKLRITAGAPVIRKMDYGRHDIFLDIRSLTEYHTRATSSSKEPETVEWIENFIKDGQVLYDVGANIGAYSLITSKFHEGRVKVYAFEPHFVTYAQLCSNIYLNGCQDTIMPMQVALSDETKVDVFNYANLTPGGALHALGQPIDFKGDSFDPVLKQPVLAFTVDDLISQFNLPFPNHLKLDVDGIEFLVLQGAGKTLANPNFESILIELDEARNNNEITDFLESKDLRFHSKHDAESTANYIFKKS